MSFDFQAATPDGSFADGNLLFGADSQVAGTPSIYTSAGFLTWIKSGLGTAAQKDTGTSGTKVPLLDAANTWSATQVMSHLTVEGVTSTGATGTGKFVFDGSPTLVTPVLGVASATSINKVALTAPATGSTLTLADGKTLTVSNTLTFTGTDGSTLAIGSGGTLGTAAYKNTGTSGNTVPLLDGNNAYSGTSTFSSTVSVSAASFGLTGNISAPAWTTTGVRYTNVSGTLTDTTSSGTVATAYSSVFGGSAIAATNPTTFTNYSSVFINTPTAGTNVTLTNAWSLTTAGGIAVTGNGSASQPMLQFNGTWFTGGSGTTTKPMVLIEPSGTTSTGWDTAGTALGINAASGYAGTLFEIQIASSTKFKVTQTGSVVTVASAQVGAGQQVLWTGRGILTSPSANTIQLGTTTSSSAATAQTLQMMGSSGNSAAAAAFTIAGSDQSGTTTTGGNLVLRAGNGTTAGGVILLQTSAVGTPTTAVTVNNDQTVTFASTATFGSSAITTLGNNLTLTSTGNLTFSTRGIITSSGASTIVIGPTAAATAADQTLKAPNTTGATSTGSQLTVSGGDDTGTTTVTGGALKLKAGDATGASGTRTGGSVSIIGGTGANAGGTIIMQTAATTTPLTALTVGINQSVLANSPTGGLGYGAGAGGTVTQSTNKSTGVTLNTVSGQITMNNANLAGLASVSFTLTNSAIAAQDTVSLSIASGASVDSYIASVTAVAAGSCRIQLYNITPATTLGEAVVLNYNVIKGTAS